MVSDLAEISRVTWAEILSCMTNPEGDAATAVAPATNIKRRTA
jgi:hypothetical protein